MPHNFRITGSFYASKAGSDANVGTDPNNPRVSFLYGTAAYRSTGGNLIRLIYGTGIYRQYNLTDAGRVIVGDGKVTFDGNNTGAFSQAVAATHHNGWRLENLTVQNYPTLLGIPADLFTTNHPRSAIKCIIRNGAIYQRNSLNVGTDIQVDSIFENVTGDASRYATYVSPATADNQVYRNIYINCQINFNQFTPSGGSATNSFIRPYKCYFDETSIPGFKSGADWTALDCNIRGQLRVDGVLYANLAAAQAAGHVFTGCINADPQFTNKFAGDYTLKPNSPHLALGIGPAHLRLSTSVYLKGTESNITSGSGHYFENPLGAIIPIIDADNLTASLQGGHLRAKVIESVGGQLVGWFKTGPIRVGDVPQTLTRISFAAGENYDTDYPALESQFDPNNPQVLNNNVPDYSNWAYGQAGRNPNRMDFQMRFSNKDNPQDNVPSDWITGSTFLSFEWNEDAWYNPASVVGNGSPTFNPSAVGADAPARPVATFVQVIGTLRNNYYSK